MTMKCTSCKEAEKRRDRGVKGEGKDGKERAANIILLEVRTVCDQVGKLRSG
jgi:hypothetical protein